jgi:hypothetical protein
MVEHAMVEYSKACAKKLAHAGNQSFGSSSSTSMASDGKRLRAFLAQQLWLQNKQH